MTVLLLVALAILAVLTFHQYSISNDEWVQHQYGALILAYYKSGMIDDAVFHFDNLYLYGGLFDICAVLLSHAFPAIDAYDLRHLMCAFIGIGGIGATAATARLIAGPRAGLVAAVALAICGSWYGGMFNHTKDIPLAAAMMASCYFLIRASRDLPSPRWRDVLGFGFFAGCALGIKVLGLLLIGYAGIITLISIPQPVFGDVRISAAFVARSMLRFLPAFVLAYVMMIAAWPWAALAPLNPIRAIFSFAEFHYSIHTLFAGTVYDMARVPAIYVPAYLLIKLPLINLTAGAFAILAAMIPFVSRGFGWSARKRREIGFVAFIIAYPLACQVIGHGPAFTGMRHFFFVLPPVAVLTAIGLDAIIGWLAQRSRALAVAAFASMAVAFGVNADTLYRLHPYEYLVYNSIVGGLPGAADGYATDYWVNSMNPAIDQLEAFLERTEGAGAPGNHKLYKVAVCGERYAFIDHAKPYLVWWKNWSEADFFISPTHMHCDREKEGKVVASIERLGVPIAVVKDLRKPRKVPAVAAAEPFLR
ncbi:glycosyltransferase family 39 protein [Afipia sp. TerB]